MSEILIKETKEADKALTIAKQSSDYFSEKGLISLSNDLKIQKIYGAFLGDELLAFITFREADAAALEITWLAVSPEKRGAGIGTLLVKGSLNLLANKKYKICYVKTLAETAKDKGYEKTRSFYQKLGFNTLEIISPYPGWDKDNPCQILAASLPLE